VERTEDGTGFYYYNPITGEMKFDKDNQVDSSPAPSIVTRSTTRTTTATASTNGSIRTRDLDLEEEELDEIRTLNSSNVMMDSESEYDYRSTNDLPWSSSDASTLATSILTAEEKVGNSFSFFLPPFIIY
jgi:hypothetical protein